MIHPDEALRLIESLDCRLGGETVSLDDALGRIPAGEVRALLDQPPFDKATMDGFAYATAEGRTADVGESFVLAGSVAAGEVAPEALAPGDCLRIMTGAPVPMGACAVHRLERAEFAGGRVLLAAPEEGPNIVRRGANRLAGDPLVRRRPLKPQDIALLASDGLAELEVVRKPRVVVISTGDELRAPARAFTPAVAPGAVASATGAAASAAAAASTAAPAAPSALAPGAIYDSNGPLLVAMAREAGCEAASAGIVRDDEDALREAIASASADADLIIVSGGVSAGDYDFVPAALERNGFGLLYRGLAMRPGMPALLAKRPSPRGSAFAYGMPGNPVSAFVNFEFLVKPLLLRFAGLPPERAFALARMGEPVERAPADRVEFLPVELREGIAYPLRYTGSTMMDALSRADALIRLEIGQGGLPEGAEILARLL